MFRWNFDLRKQSVALQDSTCGEGLMFVYGRQ
jgi:hypothetical protein